MNLKFFIPLLGVISGIFLSDFYGWNIGVALVALGFSISIWLIITLLSRDPVKGLKFIKFHDAWIFLLFFSIGSINYIFLSRPYVGKVIEGEKCSVTGIIKDVNTFSEGDRFKINVISLRDSLLCPVDVNNFNIMVRTDGFAGKKGDIITFQTILMSYSSNPGIESRMKHSGISYHSSVRYNKIKKLGESHSISTFFEDFRNRLVILLEKSSLNKNTSSFISSILLGDKSLLPSQSRQTISSSGLAHSLALSGMHVAIILVIISVLLFPLSFFGYHKARKILAIVLIWVYVLISGMSPSTVRAAIMATLIFGAWMLERKNSSLNALFVAIIIILLLDPLSLWNIGLQLSFICVASIILFVNKFNTVDHHVHPILYKSINYILISIVTTLCSWVVVAYYYNSVPLLFLPANIFLLPLLPFFIGFSILYLILLNAGLDIKVLGFCLDKFHDYFFSSADVLSLSGRSVINVTITEEAVLLWLLGIVCASVALYTIHKRKKTIYGMICGLLLVLSVTSFFLKENSDNGNIRFLHSFNKIETHVKFQGIQNKLEFPRNMISKHKKDNLSITTVDALIRPEAIKKLHNEVSELYSYLIIGPGADMAQMAQLIASANFSGIILHSVVGEKKKEELFSLLDETHWHKIYSLRENGSLEFSL